MSNFIIQKTTTGNFYHIYNNARTKVNVSDFDVVLDDVALTFIIQCKNGSNIPSQAVSINLIQVIDLSLGTSPIPFSGIDELILLLKSISYTPYLQSLIITEPIRIYEVGQVGVFTMTPTQFTDNFHSNGLGKNTMLGWALRNGNNGTKNQQGKFSLNKGASPYDVIGAIGGSANSVLIGHSHEVGSYEKEGEPNTITYTNIGLQEGSSNLYKYTKKKGQANNGADTPSEDGVGKNMPPYLIDVWVERVTALIFSGATGGGEGGSQTWSQTLDNGRNTGGFNPLINNDDAIDFENGSYIARGTDEATGGNGGIEQTCSIGYKWKWESGEIYIRNQGNNITRKENARFAPTVNDDDASGFIVYAFWEMYDGTLYKLLDSTEGAAVWEIYGTNLEQVLSQGDRIFKGPFNTYTIEAEDIYSYVAMQEPTPAAGSVINIDPTIFNKLNGVCLFSIFGGNGVINCLGAAVMANNGDETLTTLSYNQGDVISIKHLGSEVYYVDIVNKSSGINGLPSGGTAGQILTKVDSTDYNATWQENYADWTSVVKHTVKNNGAGLITKGTAVYVTGSNGTNMLVGKASNASEATSSKTMGLMQSDITTTGGTQTGFVVTEGLLSGLNTAGQTAGDPVWLGVNGALIYGLANKPYAPAHLVFIGIVTKVSAGNGEIFVKVQNGFELKEIHDVDLVSNSPTNNQGLVYESATSLWKNKTIIEDTIVNGVTDKAPSQNAVFDALSFTRQLITKGTGSGTGTLTETILTSLTIPANTLDASCFIWSTMDFFKTNAGSVTARLYINSSNTLTGATLLGLVTIQSSRNVSFNRKFLLNGTSLDLLTANTASTQINNEFVEGIFGASTVLTVNPTANIFLIYTTQNDSVGTIGTNKMATVQKMKL